VPVNASVTVKRNGPDNWRGYAARHSGVTVLRMMIPSYQLVMVRVPHLLLASIVALCAWAQPPVFHTTLPQLQWRINGALQNQPWVATPSARPDVAEVICRNGPGSVTFIGEHDSMQVVVKPGEQVDFVVLVPGMDSAFTRAVGRLYLPPEPPHADVQRWLRSSAAPLTSADLFTALDPMLKEVRVLALGEATHGQHESFELNRAWTMHLVRNTGYRYVAYEASASKARACEEYIAGRNNDRAEALSGLGMLIWMVEENAALLDDLRAGTNTQAPPIRYTSSVWTRRMAKRWKHA